ncbi:MAG: hypothetical protein D6680_18810 [Cyanobacteria bacterium J007]|nr:MAG: hypothetical protein D6680_18810 [Cyanobacteria bacterium J007]
MVDFSFRVLQFPRYPEIAIRHLTGLLNSTSSGDRGLKSLQIPPQIPQYKETNIRKIDELIDDILNYQGAGFSEIEWIYCLYCKEEWDRNHQELGMISASYIWKVAIENDWLRNCLFWRLALYFDRPEFEKTKYLPRSLANTFTDGKSELENVAPLSIQTLECLRSYRSEDLTKLSLDNVQTPRNLLASCYLPLHLSIVNEALNAVGEIFVRFVQSKNCDRPQQEWLLDCLTEMSHHQQLEAVTTLLSQLSTRQGQQLETILNWLQNNYGPYTPRSHWNELSDNGQSALMKWLGALNYNYFRELVDLLLERLNLPEWEQKQLKKRKKFWSHYSDRFKRIRILLPPSSIETLGKVLSHQNISVIREDASKETEVCIFDFGDWAIAEFFRGEGSETRIFKTSSKPEIKRFLFESTDLSLKQIRCLGGEVLDHKFLWQYYSEQTLRSLNLYMNEGTRLVKGLPPGENQYNPERGLPEPNLKKQQERQHKLKQWQDEIKRIEREAKARFKEEELLHKYKK